MSSSLYQIKINRIKFTYLDYTHEHDHSTD